MFMIGAFLVLLFVFFKRIGEIKTESLLREQEMSEAMDDLVQDHDEELNFERNIASAHCIKMRMQQRDYNSKVGSLQRKLKEKSDAMKALNSKLTALEWAEEDANELVDELVKAREQIRMRDELIESLRNQLKATQLKKDETIQFKNNTLQENKSSNIL
ncbi:hypothetical protein CRE_15503 [Caenorhabditis remanei]|uniref:Uncharacterized protein n=1 Tax=Caenorhabditis remanei TaxID=31234 RepID=E3MSZ3_CAERE|nr:hypothetical protein CRE_15503 [Caenorhabditis remanei]